MEDELKKLILEKYESMRNFSDKIGLPNSTVVSILERGIKNSNMSNVMKLCKGLNISIDKLIDENKIVNLLQFDNAEYIDTSNVVQIPVFGTIKAGIPIESQNDITEYVEIPKSWIKGEKKFFGLKISGDSMYPKYDENDIVIFEQNNDSELFNGKDVAVMINGTESTFKKILVNEKGIVLQPYNMAYDIMMFSKEQVNQLPIKVVGIAKEKRTRL